MTVIWHDLRFSRGCIRLRPSFGVVGLPIGICVLRPSWAQAQVSIPSTGSAERDRHLACISLPNSSVSHLSYPWRHCRRLGVDSVIQFVTVIWLRVFIPIYHVIITLLALTFTCRAVNGVYTPCRPSGACHLPHAAPLWTGSCPPLFVNCPIGMLFGNHFCSKLSFAHPSN